MATCPPLDLFGCPLCRCCLYYPCGLTLTPREGRSLAREESEAEEMEYINNALDGAMMDDYSLYVYLADESTANP